jgi:hypothetical protein
MMQEIKVKGMNKQEATVGLKEAHVERMLRESLIKNLIKV